MTHQRKLLDTAPLNWREIPRRERLTVLAAGALALHPRIFAMIARRKGVSRQHVAGVAYGERQSAHIEHALRMAVARQRYP